MVKFRIFPEHLHDLAAVNDWHGIIQQNQIRGV